MSTFEIIHSNKDQIINKWLARLRVEMPVINDHQKSAIENSVPELLDAIIECLKSDDTSKVEKHSRQHGFERTKFKEYSLRHIIQEYNLFKTEILHTLDDYAPINPYERDTIMGIVDEAIEQAAEIFHRIKQGVHVNARQVAEKKAQELELEDENREEFIHSISHDLNNPLNNIKGCIGLLEGDLEVGEVHEILRILKTSANQAESLIKDFLDVGKISTREKLPIERKRTNVLEEIKNEIKVYQVSLKREIAFMSDQDEIIFDLDVDLFIRAFNNLLNNALKHGDPDSKITVSCNLNDDHLHVSVQNYGKVIPTEVLENIFNRYYRVDGKRKGWGIGLAFVREVIKSHHGEVSVVSNQKEGTVFEMKIPKEA